MTKIKVSTHDNDTKNIDVTLQGTVLHIDIGEDKNQVDLVSLIPAHKDFKVTSGSFDTVSRTLKLVVSNNTERDEVIIPLQGLLDVIPTIKGQDGAKGDRGERGPAGANGVNGKSAYELAVQNGYIGSMTEWLASLKGERGEQGPRGPKGENGSAGIPPLSATENFFKDVQLRGNVLEFKDQTTRVVKSVQLPAPGTGPQGPQGVPGPAGPRGPQGLTGASGPIGPQGPRGRDGNSLDLNTLPTSQWKEGTIILAKQDGVLKGIQPTEAFFQEIGVQMTADKLVSTVGDSFEITVTVTNSGNNTNTQTDLVITTPSGGGYTSSNYRITQGSNRATKTNNLNYVIRNLGAGEVVKVKFNVNLTEASSYQFGASINPNTTLDIQKNNNTTSITLSGLYSTDTTANQGRDCPLITATANGKNLVSINPFLETQLPSAQTFTREDIPSSVVMGSLRGLSINMPNATTVLVVRMTEEGDFSTEYFGIIRDTHNNLYREMSPTIWRSNIPIYQNFVGTTDRYNLIAEEDVHYTFNRGNLVLQVDDPGVLIATRGAGKDCKWQTFFVKSSVIIPKVTFSTTYIGEQSKRATMSNEGSFGRRSLIVLGEGSVLDKLYRNDPPLKAVEELKITLRKGVSTTFTVTASGSDSERYFENTHTAGNIKLRGERNILNVTVSSSVNESDSFTIKNVQFNVE